MTLAHFSEYFDRTLATHTLVQDLKADRGLRERFGTDQAGVLSRYELRPEERAAIEAHDFRRLYTLGVHPYALGQLARLIFGTVEGAGSSEASSTLVRALRQEEETR